MIAHGVERVQKDQPGDKDNRRKDDETAIVCVSERNVLRKNFGLGDTSTFFVCLVLGLCSNLRTMRVVVVWESSIAS
jgi:hypothetical protein